MSMDAVVYKSEREVAVGVVEELQIQHPNDVVIDVTTTCICGPDLHMYEGRTTMEPGIVSGHGNMGIVEEVGDTVSSLEVNDRVVAPFNVVCSSCENCGNGYIGLCTNVNPSFAGGTYGYVAMGPYQEGQAEKLRVLYVDFNAFKLPDRRGHKNPFALLADIFPAGWHDVKLADLESDDSVAIYGASPVDLMTAYDAKLKGAAEIYVVDRVPSRLAFAEGHCDATPINFEEGDPVGQIEEIHGNGIGKGVGAVDYQAIDPEKEADSAYGPTRENPTVVISNLIRTVRPTSELGTSGLYVPDDPGAPDKMTAQGHPSISFGLLFEKGQALGTSQCNVKEYNQQLRGVIIEGRIDPSWVISHRTDLESTPEMYEKFDNREEGVAKVLLEP